MENPASVTDKVPAHDSAGGGGPVDQGRSFPPPPVTEWHHPAYEVLFSILLFDLFCQEAQSTFPEQNNKT